MRRDFFFFFLPTPCVRVCLADLSHSLRFSKHPLSMGFQKTTPGIFPEGETGERSINWASRVLMLPHVKGYRSCAWFCSWYDAQNEEILTWSQCSCYVDLPFRPSLSHSTYGDLTLWAFITLPSLMHLLKEVERVKVQGLQTNIIPVVWHLHLCWNHEWQAWNKIIFQLCT